MEAYPNAFLYYRLVKAKLYIDENYHQSIDLDNISGEAYCSKFHFIRLFSRIFGCTPHQYLIRVRISKARELLLSGMPASEVCGEVGFESISSFTSLFKKMAGATPAAWQAAQQQLKSLKDERPLLFIPGCFAKANGWIPETIS